jgi:hypothetical protein
LDEGLIEFGTAVEDNDFGRYDYFGLHNLLEELSIQCRGDFGKFGEKV